MLEIFDIRPSRSGILNLWKLDLEFAPIEVTTAASGYYSVFPVVPFTYGVDAPLAAGWIPTAPNPPDSYAYPVYVTSGDTTQVNLGRHEPSTAPPTLTAESQATGIRSPALTGTVGATATSVKATVNGTEYPATLDGSGNWNLPAGTILPQLGEGTYVVTVTARDESNSTTRVTAELIIDWTVPDLEVSPGVGVVPQPDGTWTVPADGSTRMYWGEIMKPLPFFQARRPS